MDANGSDDLGPADISVDVPIDASTDLALDVSVDVVDVTSDLTSDASADVPEDLIADDALIPDAPALDVDTCTDAGTRCPGPDGGAALCVELPTDPANCGRCGNTCPAAQMCVSGMCACPMGQALCGGACVTTDSDPANRCAANGGCAALLASSPGLANGVYLIDVDGDGPSTPTPLYCDMTGGGWTLVVNQVPGAPLPDTNGSVNVTGFGALDQSWRLGNPDITRVRPTVAWKLTDASNSVYVSPMCVVDWDRNYNDTMVATACTVGYASAALTTIVNGRWVYCSARGIGINNSGAHGSIRASEGGLASQGAMPHGRAASCNYTITERVSLWYR